jgi:hypothetical protein
MNGKVVTFFSVHLPAAQFCHMNHLLRSMPSILPRELGVQLHALLNILCMGGMNDNRLDVSTETMEINMPCIYIYILRIRMHHP